MTRLQEYANAFEGNQRDLAAKFKISQPYLSLLLAGKKQPSLELAFRIDKATDGFVPVSCWIAVA